MNEPSTDQTFPTTDTAWAETASRLLELQQKLDACDRLYNEELRDLRKELSQLITHYMREYQATRLSGQPRRQRRTVRPPWDAT
jgi:CO dehydrogenase/acetyl-CoA synthase gamma subunit (corrinoid Fe-S protein)